MLRVLTVKISFDPAVITQDQITDSLNEHLHGIAVEEDWTENPDTGGYVPFDWTYVEEGRD